MSSLSFRTAARTEALLDAFAAEVRERPLRGPLVREAVVVARSTAMRAYVEGGLARSVGCAASVDLQSPRLFVAELARRFGLVPPAPAGRAYEATALAWRIAGLLPTLDGPLYAALHAYLDRQAETDRPGGQFALAARLAAAFDDYQVYRPDVLDAWADGRTATAGWPHEPWQADLWRRLLAEAPVADDGAPERDRAWTVRELTRRLGGPVSANVAETFPQRVSVFGAPLLPPAYLRVLVALARHVPVTVYAALPGLDGGAPFGAEARHPLLRALGGHTRDAADLFDELDVPAPVHTSAPAQGHPGSALHTVQAALLADVPPDTATALDPADRSVRVLDAHSALREVEALRDELYDAFDTLPGLRPADVAVLVPDLATYAPLIEAVFGTSAPVVDGRRRGRPALLPVHVADPPRGPERHVLDAFDRVLSLLDGRTTASDVLGLLDVPAVRRAAAIDEAELSTVHAWVRQTRVHWGRDGDHKARHGAPGAAAGPEPAHDDGDLHTWRFGLDRLLLGVMTGPTDAVVLGRRPLGEGTLDAADLLGRLAGWVEGLFRALDALRAPRPLDAWADALLLLIDGVLAPEGTAEMEATVALRAAADRLATLRPRHAAAPDVSLGEVQAHLGHALATVDRDEPYLTGRITVVDPTAARLVPFRVVAFVGLGDAFPRSESRPAFDLLAAGARPGDPDPAGTDRQTFLDAVLSARDRLVLTFTGRSQRDGTERAASSALDAFLDTCALAFGRDADRLVVRHRLQPFSAAYFDGTAGLFSYAAQHRRPPQRARHPDPFFEPPDRDHVAGLPDGPPVETTLAALQRAWTHPVRHYCDERGLRPDLAEADLADDAPAELDALGLYAV
ncbi:MAG TPA: exodeoxyribonuclease V subunit gamma, partial [Rubricoccaceae bacterium]